MIKIRKSLAVFACIATILMSLGINSFAVTTAPKSISVIINEQTVDFKNVKPVMLNNRVYVPVRSFFEALGATVTYEDATQTITAIRNDMSAKLTIGSKIMIKTNKGTSSKYNMDAAPFIDGDYTMIPARYAAAAFGCTIGWDNIAQTVLIYDPVGLIKSLGAHYTIMTMYLNASNPNNTARAFEGSMYISKVGVTDKESYKISGTFTGVENKDASNLNLKLDFGNFLNTLTPGTALSVSNKILLSKMQKIDYKYISDKNAYKTYYQSPQMSDIYKIESDAWVLSSSQQYSNLSSMLPRESISPDVLGYQYSSTSFEDSLKYKFSPLALSSKATLQSIIDNFKLLNSYYCDESFKKEGNVYTNKIHTELTSSVIDFCFQIIVQNEKAISYTLTRKSAGSLYTTEYLSSMDMNRNFIVRLSSTTINTKSEIYLGVKISDTSEIPFSRPSIGKIYEEKNLKIAS